MLFVVVVTMVLVVVLGEELVLDVVVMVDAVLVGLALPIVAVRARCSGFSASRG